MTIDVVKDHADLALAAYAFNLSRFNASGENQTLYRDAGMSESQAAAFDAKYAVVAHQPNTTVGFSATMFRERASGAHVLAIRGTDDLADLVTNSMLLLPGIVADLRQYQELVTFYNSMVSRGDISTSTTFTVTGHSLHSVHSAVHSGSGLNSFHNPDEARQLDEVDRTSFAAMYLPARFRATAGGPPWQDLCESNLRARCTTSRRVATGASASLTTMLTVSPC